MEKDVETLGEIVLLILWIAGVVLAKGFWSTTFSITIPPYAFYLVMERVLTIAGWI